MIHSLLDLVYIAAYAQPVSSLIIRRCYYAESHSSSHGNEIYNAA